MLGVGKEGRRKGMEGDKVLFWDSLKGSMDVAHGKKNRFGWISELKYLWKSSSKYKLPLSYT